MGYGLRGRNIDSLESVDENRGHRGHWTADDSVHRTNKLRKWEEDEDVEDPSDGEEWVSDDEVSDAIGHIDNDVAISSDTEEETSESWITGGRDGDVRLRGITTNVDESSDGEIFELEEENGESSVESVYDDRKKFWSFWP
ncbi:hypothetical protein HPP92_000962 [Vanilla planifolia]|uniref:Uncharacterized protein n=1 Tax=Vanilla planifolia TaxID=51239 RepID=A0A835VH51_VANPL|nr:hypothetical protein HPP92_000962 [Vanilla planifolia]